MNLVNDSISTWTTMSLVQNKTENLTMSAVASNRGDKEKVLAMVVLGLGSLIAGMLPVFVSERNRQRFPFTASLLLCLGAGVLLATSMVHILPEIRQQMSSNFAEISFCGGFFLIYFIDEFIHYFFGEAIQHDHGSTESNAANSNENVSRNYGTLRNIETAPLLQSQQTETGHSHAHDDSFNQLQTHSQMHANCNDADVARANSRICHTSHSEPCAQTMTGTIGLFAALSFHSAIEGLTIGVQNSGAKVLFLLGAVACHKFVMAFCLGLEFRSNSQTSVRTQFYGILVFVLGVICGIGLGMIIVDMPNTSVLPVTQALAGGTLLYVTTCEVVPREKARWHQSTTHKLAGFAQLLSVFCGFTIMCVINFYAKDDDS